MNLAKKYKQLFEGKTRSNDSRLLNEATEGELIDIHKPFKFWEVEGERLKKELKRHKMEAKGSFGGGEWSKVEMPFGSRIQYVRSRTVLPRRMFGTNDDNQLLSIVRIFIKVLTDKNSQRVKDGEKKDIDNLLSFEIMVEYNHARGGFTIDESWAKWYHPVTGKVFNQDLRGGAAEHSLEDYIVKDIKHAVKKRGKRIQGHVFSIV